MLIQLYWNLPYRLKCAAVSVQAARWDRQRHGHDYQETLSRLEARRTWTRQLLLDDQARQLRSLMRDAGRTVPYYRGLLREHGIDPARITCPADLVHLPILEKETVRTRSQDLVDERYRSSRLITVSTSGTTGSPLELVSDVSANSARHAFLEARWRAVAGVSRRRDRSISACGHLVAAPHRDRPPFWVENRRWRQLYLSSYHLSSTALDHYVDAMRRFDGVYLEGYPSSLYAIARHIIDRDIEPLRLKACTTTAEVLYEHQRTAFAQAFGCRTFDQYGCAEMAVFAAECPDGSMHLSPEMGVVEVLDEHDRPVEPGVAGQLICTGLINRAQPLIRYRLGDSGALSTRQCTCGSPLPVLDRVEGRTDDLLISPDGRRIGRLDPVLKGVRGVRQAQIVQVDVDRLVIRLVAASSYDAGTERALRTNLAHRTGGQMQIEVERVEELQRSPRGKLRSVVCLLPPETRARLLGERTQDE